MLVDEAPPPRSTGRARGPVEAVQPDAGEPVRRPSPRSRTRAAVRTIDSPEPEPVDLLDDRRHAGGQAGRRRCWPLIAVVWVLKKLLTRSRD